MGQRWRDPTQVKTAGASTLTVEREIDLSSHPIDSVGQSRSTAPIASGLEKIAVEPF